jgi:hypothetical protein
LEDLDCIPLNLTQGCVNYHCNFELPNEWRGALLRLIMGRDLDSLSRLK